MALKCTKQNMNEYANLKLFSSFFNFQQFNFLILQWFSWADCFALVYDISDEESFLKLKFFRDEIGIFFSVYS